MFHLLNCSFVLSVKLFEKRYLKKPKETQPQEQVTEEGGPKSIAASFHLYKNVEV